MPFTAELLVKNLKALNAKERDHLMRFAYLGVDRHYEEEDKCWLSTAMTKALRAELHLSADMQPIFAGMDYHLDWLYAALQLTCDGKSIPDALKREPKEVLGGDIEPPKKSEAYDDKADATLCTVSGRQEDVDLLVVFAEGDKVLMLFIEAKGVAKVDPRQLARKLIRLDRILESSKVPSLPNLECKFVLIGPRSEKKRSDSFKQVALTCNQDDLIALLDNGKDASGIWEHMNFVELAGFPATESLGRVARVKIPTEPGKYRKWKIAKRNYK